MVNYTFLLRGESTFNLDNTVSYFHVVQKLNF